MNKKEKYINFIADDLNSRVEFSHYKLGFPWSPFRYIDRPLGKFPINGTEVSFFKIPKYRISSSHMKLFKDYVKENYGVSDSEVTEIYNLFREKLLDRI